MSDKLLTAALEMERIGGSFAAAIAKAYILGDSHNKQRVVAAFPELFERYGGEELPRDSFAGALLTFKLQLGALQDDVREWRKSVDARISALSVATHERPTVTQVEQIVQDAINDTK